MVDFQCLPPCLTWKRAITFRSYNIDHLQTLVDHLASKNIYKTCMSHLYFIFNGDLFSIYVYATSSIACVHNVLLLLTTFFFFNDDDSLLFIGGDYIKTDI